MKLNAPLLGLILFSGALIAAEAAPARPNFVIIIADDMGWNDSTPYGHPRIQTPHLDRMAKAGMRFDNAYLTCSSCSPSRCSLNTGRYPHNTGAGELHLPMPGDQVLFASELRKLGYHTAAAGKWHMGPDVKKQYDVVKEGGGEGGYADWMNLLADRPRDKPFYLYLASTDPHRPYGPNAIRNPHKPGDVVVPPYLPDVPEVRADLALYYDEIGRLDEHVGRVMAELKKQNVLDNTLVLFMSDNGRPFPRAKTTVYEDGNRTPFIIQWPAVVKGGQVNANLVSSVDVASTFVDLAGGKPAPSFQGVSFAATLRDPKVKVRNEVFAEHNWHDYTARKRSIRTERYLYIRNDCPELTLSPPADAVKSDTFQAMIKLHEAGKLPQSQSDCFTLPRPAEELYDVVKDRFQMTSIAADPAQQTTLAELRKSLDEWQTRTGDVKPDRLRGDEFDRRTGNPIPGAKKGKAAGKAGGKAGKKSDQ